MSAFTAVSLDPYAATSERLRAATNLLAVLTERPNLALHVEALAEAAPSMSEEEARAIVAAANAERARKNAERARQGKPAAGGRPTRLESEARAVLTGTAKGHALTANGQADMAVPTPGEVSEARTVYASLAALADKASTLAKLRHRVAGNADAADRVDAALRANAEAVAARYAALTTISPEVYAEWNAARDYGLTAEEAAVRNSDGYKWNTSESNGEDFSGPTGGTNVVRANQGTSNNKAHTAYAGRSYADPTAAIREALSEGL